MKEEKKSNTQYLYKTLLEQNEVLGTIIAQQQLLRVAVTSKNWDQLENTMKVVNNLADKFSLLEEKRLAVCVKLNSENPNDIFIVSRFVPPAFKKPIIEIFHQVRQKLAVSKIENDAVNEYIRVTKDFLQGVFDTVLPHRRNMLYSSTGAMIKAQPDSVVLNTIV